MRIKMGMIGGSLDAFIGNVHRMAAALDNQIELVAGVFSSSFEKTKETAKALYLHESRIYEDYQTFILQEAQKNYAERIDFISIVTPNNLHFEPAKLALENGFHVFCEKPVCVSVEEAEFLEKLAHEKNLLFAVAHTYTGYPMIKEAKNLVASGFLGKIRKVIVDYPQGWLSSPIENYGQKQASWRTNPQQAGISCCVGDIGTHAFNLAEYISGEKIQAVAADVSTFISDRKLDDDVSVLLRFQSGAKGILQASQVLVGEENTLSIRVYGEKASLSWSHHDVNTLHVKFSDKPTQTYRTGAENKYLHEQTRQHTRLPSGHPEGFLEAFANLYRNFAYAIQQHKNNKSLDKNFDFPTIHEGVRGMKFIQAVITSGEQNATWQTINS